MLAALLVAAAPLAVRAQLPTWHSPNYQCKDALAPWPVCRDPRALAPGYRQQAFPVWAWAGPWGYDSVTETPAELDAYAAANFNIAQVSDRDLPHRYLSFNESWAFVTRGVLAAAKRGLQVSLDPYGPINRPYAGIDGGMFSNGAGGVYGEAASYTKKLTPPELEWLIPVVRDDPDFASVSSILVSDDAVDLTSEQLEMAGRIAQALPDVIPLMNQCGNGKIWVARSGSPVLSPELYAMMDPTQDVVASSIAQAGMYDNECAQNARWRLLYWPMLGATNYDSGSVTAWQANAALALGADGLSYFLWSFQGQGLWNNTLGVSNPNNYAAGREANGNALAWGDDLQAFNQLAVSYHTSWVLGGQAGSALPGDNLVAAMDEQLMLSLRVPPGVFDDGAPVADAGAGVGVGAGTGADADAVAVLVDKRVAWSGGPPAARVVSVSFGALVDSVEVVVVDLSAFDSWRAAGRPISASAAALQARSSTLFTRAPGGGGGAGEALSVNATLTGGSAVLLRIRAANSSAFSVAARAMRNWRINTAAPSFFELRNAQQSFYNNLFTMLPTSWSHFPMAILDLDALAAVPAAAERVASWTAPPAPQRGRCGAPAARPAAAYAGAPADAGVVLRGFATAGFNLFSAASTGGEPGDADSLYVLMQAAMAAGAWLLAAPPAGAAAWNNSALAKATDAYFCHPAFGGFVLSPSASPASAANASAAAALAAAVRWASPYSYAPQLAADFAAVDALRRANVPMAALTVPGAAGLPALLAQLALLRALLLAQQAAPPPPGGIMPRDTASGFVGVDACAPGARESAASLSFRAWASIAYGAKGLIFAGAARCAAAPPDAGLLDALAVVGQQVAGFKGSSIGQWLTGASLVSLFASDPARVPGAEAPGAGKLVLSLGPDLIVAVLHSGGNTSAPSALVVDASCVGAGGCAGSWVQATATFDAIGWGAYEADGAKGFTSCAKTVVGGAASVTLAPGGGELLLLDVVAP